MRILIDIGHPAHVHYYKYLIKKLETESQEVHVIARNKSIIQNLLQEYQIEYIDRGAGAHSWLGKLLYLIWGNIFVWFYTVKLKPDILLSHGGIYTAMASYLTSAKSVTTEDTDNAKFSHIISKRFSDNILTPEVLPIDLGKKQVKFKSYMELAYLNERDFKPRNDVLQKYNFLNGQRFAVVRFIDWKSHHDTDQKRLTNEEKKDLVDKLSEKCRIILSFEENIPEHFASYMYKIDPEDMHQILSFASLYIGEGITTASEAAILGTPAILINSSNISYCNEQKNKYNLLFQLITKDEILLKADEILNTDKSIFEQRKKKLHNDNINTTDYLYEYLKAMK